MSLKKSDIAKNIASKTSISESRGKNLVSSFIDFIKLKTITTINSGDEITVDYTKHDWIKKD